jgi:hypothetical protein
LGHTEVKVATNVGRETLLSGLQDDDAYLTLSGHLIVYGILEDDLGWLEFEGLYVTIFGSYL